MLRFLTAGESHGKAEVAILEGIPAGLAITKEEIQEDLAKRAHDFGRGGRGKIETDEVKILSGVRHGKTLGSPIALLVENRDFANWEKTMNTQLSDATSKKVTTPRPGHADLPGILKYGFDDVRNVLERASARETVMRVAIGAVCKKLLSQFAIAIASHTLRIGKVALGNTTHAFDDIANVYHVDPDIHCIDATTREQMREEITNARLSKNTLGGIVEVVARGVPVGLGSYVQYDRRLDGRVAQALMSIPSVKAVEIGNGIDATGKTGKEIQDAIDVKNGRLARRTNNMGGIEGGISNGENIVVRIFHKPLSTIYDPLPTVDITTKRPAVATIERSDVCVVARAGVVSEAMLAFVLTQALLEKFGADSLEEVKRNHNSYLESLPLKI